MPLFRCINPDCSDTLGSPEFDFEDKEKTGTCPQCGSTNKENPQIVLPRVAVHYLLNDPQGPIVTPQGRRRILCAPALRRLTGTHQASGMVAGVTCPDCMKSPIFREHEEEQVDQNVPTLLKKGTPI